MKIVKLLEMERELDLFTLQREVLGCLGPWGSGPGLCA